MSKGLTNTLFLLACCSPAFADLLVVPNVQATAAGNQPIALGSNTTRTQQVIGGGQFPGPVIITGLRFRSATGTGPVNATYSSYKVILSTTTAFPNTIHGHTLPSTTFATNVGPDATTVFDGPVTASSPGCAAPGPCPFDLELPFSTPFSYDPTKGRLLVDFVSSAATGTPSGSLDGVVFPDSTSSSVAVVVGDPSTPAGKLFLAGFVLGLETTSNYYFPQIAFGAGWQTTMTYVNYSPGSVTCQTSFYDDSGNALAVPFGGLPVNSRSDQLSAGGTLHQQTMAGPGAVLAQGWALAVCSGPVKASMLYRFYKDGLPQGEAGVNAMTAPANEFVTFAESHTGIAYANPTSATASVTVTVLSNTGSALGSKAIQVPANAHGAANLGPLLGLNTFIGSVQITSDVPIVCLSLNAEAFPVFSALPPGDLPNGTPLAPGH